MRLRNAYSGGRFEKLPFFLDGSLSPLHYPYAIPSDGWKQDSNLHFGVVALPLSYSGISGSGIRTHDSQRVQTIYHNRYQYIPGHAPEYFGAIPKPTTLDKFYVVLPSRLFIGISLY